MALTPRRQRKHRPVVAALPGALESGERHYLAALRSSWTLLLIPLAILLNFSALYPRLGMPCGETALKMT